jgi:hypothetical protein
MRCDQNNIYLGSEKRTIEKDAYFYEGVWQGTRGLSSKTMALLLIGIIIWTTRLAQKG